MISKAHEHVSVISSCSFHPSYLARICVKCLDESSALRFEKGDICLLSLAAPSRATESCQARSTCLRFHIHRHVVDTFVAAFKHTTPHQKHRQHALLDTTSGAKVTYKH